MPEPTPTGEETAIAIAAVAVFLSIAAIRMGFVRALMAWLGLREK